MMVKADPQTTTKFEFKVGRLDDKKRLDLFLSGQDIAISRSQIKKLIDENFVSVNNFTSKAGAKLNAGDKVNMSLPPPKPIKLEPENIPLEIIFEDDFLIVVNKPAGLVVHPAVGNYRGTLANALIYHFQNLSREGSAIRPGIVHRLDKDTSGLMVVAKDDYSHQNLSRQFKDHIIKKKYFALVHGSLKTEKGTIISNIGRHPGDRKKMSAHPRVGRKAITHWKLIESYYCFSLLEIIPETGRTHQIRVHLSDQHNPVLGDPVYSSKKILSAINEPLLFNKLKLINRQMLHAGILGLTHPKTQIYLEFSSPLPEDMEEVIQLLKKWKQTEI